MRARLAILALTTGFLATSCTSGSPATTPSASVAPPPSTSAVTPSPVGTTLADGSALPSGCTGKPVASETVAFVAEGRSWALDPASGRLSCLFTVRDPGAFTFGPQGDRVLLSDLGVHGLSADAPTWPAVGTATPTVFDWGHPIGLAVVYATGGLPEKRFMDDGTVERLSALPKGRYQAIAYHPSGLALAFIVDEGERQGIWLSSNEGKDPQRLVFSRPETAFSSLAFSPDGEQLWWIAQHPGAISEIHAMDLRNRTGFSTILTRGLGPTATDLRLAPAGPLKAATEGTSCADRRAMVIDRTGAWPAMEEATAPTVALGWLDATTLLVAQGDCDGPQTLSAVHWVQHSGNASVLVNGVDLGATRTILHDAPTSVPAPPNEAPPAPPGGVG